MPVVHLPRPLYVVEVGPFPGCYASEEGYREYCRQRGVVFPAADQIFHRRTEMPDLQHFLEHNSQGQPRSLWLAEEVAPDTTPDDYLLYLTVGFFYDEDQAFQWAEGGGQVPHPQHPGKKIPARRVQQLSEITPPIPPEEVEKFLNGE